MTTLAGAAADLFWRSALGVVPLALLVALVCRFIPCRPWTRHALWLLVVVWLLVPPFIPSPQLDVSTTGGPVRELAEPAEPLIESAGPELPLLAIEAGLKPAWAAPPAMTIQGAQGWVADARGASTSIWPLPEAAPPRPHPTATLDEDPSNAQHRRRNHSPTSAVPAGADLPPSVPGDARIDVGPAMVVGTRDAQTPSHRTEAGEAALWRQWLGGLIAIRDAIGRLPPIPWTLWLVGAVVMVGLRIRAARSLHRRLRAGHPAPASVGKVVVRAARDLGLRKAPDTVMVDDRLSPMVWFGRRRTLILPAALWSELDPIARRAVVVHELAHLRRRDHWVVWLDLLVGSVYWWHPVAWWARSRLRAAAEDCCDAWVTLILPHGRRAYAEALLAARRFVSEDVQAVPAVGFGAATKTAQRFARRLTMVMTKSDPPRVSLPGTILVAAIAMAGWLATPAQSCPPKTESPKNCCPSEKPWASAVKDQFISIQPPRPKLAAPAFMVAGGGPPEHGHGSNDLEQRMERLERQLHRLSEQLAQTADLAAAGRAGRGRRDGVFVGEGGQEQETIIRAYSLPEGKLKALTELMVRPDVPVLVSPGKEEITVQGSALEHRVFEAFVNLINGQAPSADWNVRGFAGPRPTAYNVAPEFIYAQQAGLQAQIGPAYRTQVSGMAEGIRRQARETEARAEAIEQKAQELDQNADTLEEKADTLRETAELLREKLHDADRQARAQLKVQLSAVQEAIQKLQSAANSLRHQAEQLLEEAESVEERADNLDERADEIDDVVEVLNYRTP